MPQLVEKYIEARIKKQLYRSCAIMPDLPSTRAFKTSQKEERRVIKFVSNKKNLTLIHLFTAQTLSYTL